LTTKRGNQKRGKSTPKGEHVCGEKNNAKTHGQEQKKRRESGETKNVKVQTHTLTLPHKVGRSCELEGQIRQLQHGPAADGKEKPIIRGGKKGERRIIAGRADEHHKK